MGARASRRPRPRERRSDERAGRETVRSASRHCDGGGGRVSATDLRIDLGRLRRDIEALAAIGQDPAGGISRPAWSPAHEEARAWLLAELRAAGLGARVDPAGNVFGRLDGAGPVVMTGSHIDTVPR